MYNERFVLFEILNFHIGATAYSDVRDVTLYRYVSTFSHFAGAVPVAVFYNDMMTSGI
jgi:hypothetical protein